MILEKNQATTPSLEAHRKHAQERLAATNQSIVDIARANTRLREAAAGSECTGVLIFGPTELRIEDMRFDDGTVLEFAGSGWRAGLGSTSRGMGVFNVTPSELVADDEVSYQMFFIAAGLGGVEITFWKGTEFLGYFTAMSLSGPAGSFAATGKFKYA